MEIYILSYIIKMKSIIKQLLREELSKAHSSEIICFHSSNDLEHMENANFSMEMSNDVALFGHAIYFSESSNVDQFGKYLCKFSIKLDQPVLDMNKVINGREQQTLLDKFNKMFNTKIEMDIDDNLYPNVQYGDFFGEISDTYNWDYNIHYKKFIQSLGFNSFKYFGNSHTDFIDRKGDYGLCYGIYNPNNIKFIDGPF